MSTRDDMYMVILSTFCSCICLAFMGNYNATSGLGSAVCMQLFVQVAMSLALCNEASCHQKNAPIIAAPGPNTGMAKTLQATSDASCFLLLANQNVTRVEEMNATARSHFSRWWTLCSMVC